MCQYRTAVWRKVGKPKEECPRPFVRPPTPRLSEMAAAAAAAKSPVGPSMRDFTILQSLGKGSYGSVFKAVRKSDGFEYVRLCNDYSLACAARR